MRILILGGEGMLGHKAFQVLSQRFEVYVTFRESQGLWQRLPLFAGFNRARLIGGVDAANLATVGQVLDQFKPEAVINCIGIIKQRDEAKMAIPAIQINGLFPHQLAELCGGIGARLIHISTDCVFSGKMGDYKEEDIPDPTDLYGRSKLIGELDRDGCLTLRTSMIGWELKHHLGLLEWFAAQRRSAIQGYQCAIYSGFSTKVLANLIGDLLQDHPKLKGVYHVASEPISKYDLLLKLRDAFGWKDISIAPNNQFKCDRSLNSTRFQNATAWRPPRWDNMIAELADEWNTYEQWRQSS